MGYLPIFLDVGGRPCLVIGCGEVAEARIRRLLEAGATVTVVGRDCTDEIKMLAASGRVRYLARDYEYGDLHGSSLAYVATAEPEIARCAAREARELAIPLNAVDDPRSSTFISPAAFARGDLQIAISTGGSSPAVASMIREQLQQQIGPGYAVVLEVMRRARQFLGEHEPAQSVRAGTLKCLAQALLASVERLDYPLLDQALRRHLHAGMDEVGLGPQNCRLRGIKGAAAHDD
jgi:siroheme synthase-like protein